MTPVSSLEPMLPEDRTRYLENLAAQLLSLSSALHASIHPVLRRTLGGLVRSMNCYYSNLIENHPTLPRDINKALQGEFAVEAEKRKPAIGGPGPHRGAETG